MNSIGLDEMVGRVFWEMRDLFVFLRLGSLLLLDIIHLIRASSSNFRPGTPFP